MSYSIKAKTTFVGEYATYKTLTERVNTFAVILPSDLWNKIHRAVHPVVVVISKFFAKNFKDRPTIDGKKFSQLNATHWSHWTPLCRMWFLPIHDGRVTSKRVETNFNFPAPPLNHISGICNNLVDTWPAATRVLSRGRKREDPGNEVGLGWELE